MKDSIRVCREMTNPVPNEFSLFPKSTLGIDLGDGFCHHYDRMPGWICNFTAREEGGDESQCAH